MINSINVFSRRISLSFGLGCRDRSHFQVYSRCPTQVTWKFRSTNNSYIIGYTKACASTETKQNIALKCSRLLQTSASESPEPTVFFSFRHDENLHVARLLRSLPGYQNLFFQTENKVDEDISTLWSGLDKAELVRKRPTSHPPVATAWRSSVNSFIETAFTSQDEKLPVTHPKNQDVVDNVLKDIKLLSDEELCQVLHHILFYAPCPTWKDPAYTRIWKALDHECLRRKPTWSQDFCFVVADLWYKLNLARLSEFHWMLTKRLFRRCDKLTKEQYIRFLFCLNLNREPPSNVHVYDLEYKLLKLADQLTVEEIVVVAVSFFKTQLHIRDQELLSKLLQTAMQSSVSLDSVSVAALAKIARYCSTQKANKQVLLNFQEKFIPELPRLSITACSHLALTGTNVLAPHLTLIQKVVDRVAENVEEARLKELERVSLAMTMFNTDCDNLCKLIADQLRKPERADEIRKYGRCLPAILHYLSIRNIFIPDLMSTCLSKTFRDTYYGKNKEIFQRELLCLDIAADIELPEYTGHRLEPKWFGLIMKKNMMRLKPLTKAKVPIYDTFLRSFTEVLKTILNDEKYFHLCNILPQHHTMAVVLCQTHGQFTSIPEYFTEMETYEIKKIKPEQNLTYHALMLGGKNLTFYGELTGQGKLQYRQTKKLGYTTKIIRYDEWERLVDSKERAQFIEKILEDCKV